MSSQPPVRNESNTVKFDTGAQRRDIGPLKYHLIPPGPLRRLANRYGLGAINYGPDNWRKGIPYSEMINHIEEHIARFKEKNVSDDDLAGIAWGALTLMWYEDHPEIAAKCDDRWAEDGTDLRGSDSKS